MLVIAFLLASAFFAVLLLLAGCGLYLVVAVLRKRVAQPTPAPAAPAGDKLTPAQMQQSYTAMRQMVHHLLTNKEKLFDAQRMDCWRSAYGCKDVVVLMRTQDGGTLMRNSTESLENELAMLESAKQYVAREMVISRPPKGDA